LGPIILKVTFKFNEIGQNGIFIVEKAAKSLVAKQLEGKIKSLLRQATSNSSGK